jgi:DNA-binding beta-propeller fold protein YncE
MHVVPLRRFGLLLALTFAALFAHFASAADPTPEHRYLYVAVPGIRDYLQYGGHGVLVFDIDDGHKFVRRIASSGLNEKGQPSNVKGICASVALQRLYVSTIVSLISFDLTNGAMVWEKKYDGGCDRMAISPDGKIIYQPTFERDDWYALDAASGELLARVGPNPGAHNTVYGPNGREVYLAGLRSNMLAIADPATHQIVRRAGPASGAIRPFTVDGRQTRGYLCVNGLLGFEIADLKSAKPVERVEVQGFEKGKVARHGCPSHGIGLTPDEKEIWLCDAHNRRMHIFDNTVSPPKQVASLEVREEPGWITFSIDGKYAYPSTGDVIDVTTRKTVAELTDETGAPVHSEKLLEIDFTGGKAVRAGCQFGVGAVGVDSPAQSHSR